MRTQKITLVTGPTRSGKSEWAEALAEQSGRSVVYVATAAIAPEDAEWQARLAQHRQRRPSSWRLQEVPVALPEALGAATATECWVIDSLGTWLANLLDQDEETWQNTTCSLVESLQACPAQVILVAEETGWGVVPAYPMGRVFRDRLGALTRQLGTMADAVDLVVAGFALDLRQLGRPLDPQNRSLGAG